jgi:hypothetical protein
MNYSGRGATAGVAQNQSSTVALSSSAQDQSFVLLDCSEEFANCWCCSKLFSDEPHHYHRQKHVCFHWRTTLNEKNRLSQDERRERQYSAHLTWTNLGCQMCSTEDRAYDVIEDLGGMPAAKAVKHHCNQNGRMLEECQTGTGNQGS